MLRKILLGTAGLLVLGAAVAWFTVGRGMYDASKAFGRDTELWLTQCYQGVVSGDGDKTWQYGGRGDLFVRSDLSKLGLWEGLSLTLHGEGVFADDVNFAGDGSVLPLNTAMGFPRLVASDRALSNVSFTQVFPKRIALTLGKIDMLDVASKTPLVGGGGVTGFWNLAFAAPPSGLVPPAVFGALLGIPIDPVKITLGVYDPNNAMGSTGLEDPFDDGVTVLGSVTIAAPIAGRPGYHSLSAKANNKVGLDLDNLAGVLLPPESEFVLGEERGAWNVSYSFQQYLYRAPGDSDAGWGIFGQIGRSDGNPTPLDWFGSIGIGGSALLPGRPDDQFGIGFFYLSLSDDLVDGLDQIGRATGEPTFFLGDEAGIEAFYDAAITGWLRFGMDVQVIDPHEKDADTAVIGGVRLRLSL
jgi:porin